MDKESNTCANYCANSWICVRRATDHDLVDVIPGEKREVKHEKEKKSVIRNLLRTNCLWNFHRNKFSVSFCSWVIVAGIIEEFRLKSFCERW